MVSDKLSKENILSKFITGFYYPWLIAAFVTLLILVPIFRIIVIESKGKEKKEMIWGTILTGFLVMVACLGGGLFITVPKYRAANPTATPTSVPLPSLKFPGRLIFSSIINDDGNRKDFLELAEGNPSVVVTFRDASLSYHPWNKYYPSPTGKFILVYDGELDKNIILNTQTWTSYPAGMEKGNLSFSPDESFLAGSGDTVQMGDVQGVSDTNLTEAKCETYSKAGGPGFSVCLQIWKVQWYGSQYVFFEHHPGLYDESFVFPETMVEGTGLSTRGSLGVVSVDGTLLQDMKFPYYLMDAAGETVLGAGFESLPGFRDTKYVWFEAADILNGKMIPHPITSPEGFSGKAVLSPNGEFLFMSPNYLVNLRGSLSGQSEVIEFPHTGAGLPQSCLWHPDGIYVACVDNDMGAGIKTIQIYSIRDQKTQSWIPDWDIFELIAWAKE
jgi:hypothetical protein